MDLESPIGLLSVETRARLAELLAACLEVQKPKPGIVEPRAEHIEAAMAELGIVPDARILGFMAGFPTTEACEGFIASMRTLSTDDTLLSRLSCVDVTPSYDSWRILSCEPLIRHLSPRLLKTLLEAEPGFDVTCAELLNAAMLSQGITPQRWNTPRELGELFIKTIIWLEGPENCFPVPRFEFPADWRIVSNGREAVQWFEESGEYDDLREFWAYNQMALFMGKCVLGWNWQNRPFCLHLYFPKGEYADTP